MTLRVMLPLALAAALAAPLPARAGEPPGALAALESCDEIDPTFWEEDGRHMLAALRPSCYTPAPPPRGSTPRRADEDWRRFQCTVARRTGVECGELWSVAITCRCDRGGRARVFGQVVNCSAGKGELACKTDCRWRSCAKGAILPALSPTDLPLRYVTPQPAPEREPGAAKERRERTSAGRRSAWARRARSQGDLRTCFEISRPTDLWTDEGASAEASFSRCLADGIREHPTPRGCALLERTLDGDVEPADRCHARLAVVERQPRWCDQIVRRSRADACLWELASGLADAALCDRLREASPERRHACRERAATGPWPRRMRVVRPATAHDVQNRPMTPAGGAPTAIPAGTEVIADGTARWLDGTTSDAWLQVTLGGQIVYLERSALVDAAPESSGSSEPRPRRGSAAPRPVFFVPDTFVDDVALDPSVSPLSCRPQLLDELAGTVEALEQQARQGGAASRSIAGDELRAALSRSPGCDELDARRAYWGLFVDGRGAAWRKVDPSPALELAVVPMPCADGHLVTEARLRMLPAEAVLIAGMSGKGRAGEAPYQELGPAEDAPPLPDAPGTQRIALSTPRLGGFRKAFIERRVVSWMADEGPPVAQRVVDRATLVLERDAGRGRARVEVFSDVGFGKYGYSHADIRDVRLLDADFDGDVDVLLTTRNGGRYLILLQRGRPHGAPVQLRRPRDPGVGAC